MSRVMNTRTQHNVIPFSVKRNPQTIYVVSWLNDFEQTAEYGAEIFKTRAEAEEYCKSKIRDLERVYCLTPTEFDKDGEEGEYSRWDDEGWGRLELIIKEHQL